MYVCMNVCIHVVCMYVCMVIRYSKSMDLPGKVAKPARRQLNRRKKTYDSDPKYKPH